MFKTAHLTSNPSLLRNFLHYGLTTKQLHSCFSRRSHNPIIPSFSAGLQHTCMAQKLNFPRTLQLGAAPPGLRTTEILTVSFPIYLGGCGSERDPPREPRGGGATGGTLVSCHFSSQLSWQGNELLTVLTCFCREAFSLLCPGVPPVRREPHLEVTAEQCSTLYLFF